MKERKKEILSLLEKEPHDVFLLYALGMEFLSENNFEESEKYFLKILALDENHTDTLFRLGQLEQNRENEKQALEWYEKAYQSAIKKNKTKTAQEIKSYMEFLKF